MGLQTYVLIDVAMVVLTAALATTSPSVEHHQHLQHAGATGMQPIQTGHSLLQHEKSDAASYTYRDGASRSSDSSKKSNQPGDLKGRQHDGPRADKRRGRKRVSRCIGAMGNWCGGYYLQQPVPFQVSPIQSKECPSGCSGIGVCHADTGTCDCPAGWGGKACADPAKRPCTKGYRKPRNSSRPNSHIGPDKRDLNWTEPGSTYSRCAGICDDDIGACYCDPKLGNPKYGRIPAPPGSPPGAPPVQEGRPLFDPCNRLADDGKGNKLKWHVVQIPYERVYGPNGWCVADRPTVQACGCGLDGYGGLGCGLRSEMVCPNQCSGHGRCRLGFCHCGPGWFGLDCAHAATKEAATAAVARPVGLPPWLQDVTVDAWRCAGGGGGCSDELLSAAEAVANWLLLDGTRKAREAAWAKASGVDMEGAEGAFRLAGVGAGVAAAQARRRRRQRRHWRPDGSAAPATGGKEAAGATGGGEGEGGGGGGVGSVDELSAAGTFRLGGQQRFAGPAAMDGSGEAPGGPSAHERRRGLSMVVEQIAGGRKQQERLRREAEEEARRRQQEEDDERRLGHGGERRDRDEDRVGKRPGDGRKGEEGERDQQQERRPAGGGGGGTSNGLLSQPQEQAGSERQQGLRQGPGSRRRRRGEGSGSRPAPPAAGRRRPLVYVYNVPGTYVSRMLSYRLLKDSCTWRVFDADPNNKTRSSPYPYGSEPLLLEMLLMSPHRTLDPEEADFFFVPTLTTCWFHPIAGWADHPWWYVDTWSRVKHAVTFTQELLEWVKGAHPYWNRTGGADHVWHFAHDEGACWAPTEVYRNSVILTHWGRMDKEHQSGTSYYPDNYSSEVWDDPFQPQGFTHLIQGHPCYTPGKDLVLPLFRGPDRYRYSPYLGAPQPPRDILLFHRGRMGVTDHPSYSRGVRQRVANLSKDHDWPRRYNIHVGGYDEIEGEYGELLSRSVFCLVAAGDGWSARFDDAMLHGCIPVIVIDRVVGPFGHQLRWPSFSVRVRESEVDSLPELLTAILPDRVRRMQRAMAAVWHRFAWLSHPALHRQAREVMAANARLVADKERYGEPFGQQKAPWLRPLQPGMWQDDAFNTIMQWLYHKIGQRGHGRASMGEHGGGGMDAAATGVRGRGAGGRPAASAPTGDGGSEGPLGRREEERRRHELERVWGRGEERPRDREGDLQRTQPSEPEEQQRSGTGQEAQREAEGPSQRASADEQRDRGQGRQRQEQQQPQQQQTQQQQPQQQQQHAGSAARADALRMHPAPGDGSEGVSGPADAE